MSGLYILVLVTAWIFLTWLIFRFFRLLTPTGRISKRVHRVISLVIICSWVSVSFWEVSGKKMYWDARVRQRCAKDGGIRVYEQVVLPADRFDKFGTVGIRNARYARSTDQFYFETTESYLRMSSPTIIRHVTRVVRQVDGKVLGKSIRYSRSGGDIPGPWHPSSYACPKVRDAEGKLEASIFRKGGK